MGPCFGSGSTRSRHFAESGSGSRMLLGCRRPSSEDSCKPNSKTKIGRKQGREQFIYKRKQKDQWRMENHNDPTEMNISVMMAFHNGGWTCPTPFFMEDWTHRDMYHVSCVCNCHVSSSTPYKGSSGSRRRLKHEILHFPIAIVLYS